MGVIKFTQKDLDRNRPFEAGWRAVKVLSFIERLSKGKDSINHVYGLEVDVDGELREFEQTFNDKAIGFMEPFISAILRKPVEANVDYNEHAFIGGELFAEFTKEIYKDAKNPNDRGRPVNKAIGWASKDNPPF